MNGLVRTRRPPAEYGVAYRGVRHANGGMIDAEKQPIRRMLAPDRPALAWGKIKQLEGMPVGIAKL